MSSEKLPGRPRDPKVDDAILSAAGQMLAERGYARMSIGAVAALAGVSRPAVYRRYASKADLAIAALAHRIDADARPPENLDVETALVRALGHLARRLRAKHSMALVGSLLVEEEQTPELITLFRERIWNLRADLLLEILERGIQRGEIRADADLQVAVGMMIGSLYSAYLSQARIPRDWPRRTVGALIAGLR